MLTVQEVRRPLQIREFLKNFDPNRTTWLVSDLQSKLDIHRDLLSRTSVVPAISVLRASEFWRLLLGRVRPDLQVVSREFMTALIGQKLSSLAHEWARSPGTSKTIYDYMTQLMPILSHPDGSEMMTEWFQEWPAAKERWGHWYEVACEIWNERLQDGMIAPPWAAGVLANEPSIAQPEVWNRDLVVDLGAEVDHVEADLMVQLSQSVQDLRVTVLRPKPEWGDRYALALSAYDVFTAKFGGLKVLPAEKSVVTPQRRRYKKFTTMLGEVKDTVAQVRSWLDAESPLKASDVAIVAPDIEVYWPALMSSLAQEGISAQKKHVRRLQTFPDIARWFATLRLRSGQFSESDLELALYSQPRTQSVIDFKRFQELYSSIYAREDLSRAPEIAAQFRAEISVDEEISRDDFIGWCLKHVPADCEFARIENLGKLIFTESPHSTRMTLSRWLIYFEQLAAKREEQISAGDPNGVAVMNLSSAQHSPVRRLLFLGLTEAALRTPFSTAVLTSDVFSLSNRFGFHLASEERANLEFAARWMLEDSERMTLLSVPETDFSGSILAPSVLWLEGARICDDTGDETGSDNGSDNGAQDKVTSVPRPTRWDELQLAGIARIGAERAWSSVQLANFEKTWSRESGAATPEPFAVGGIRQVSPSGIEDYLKCPFTFAAKRVFVLSDVAELDIDVDPSRRGSLMHKVFESLTVEPRRFDYAPDELAEVIDQARALAEIELGEEAMWPTIREANLKLATRFLREEKEMRSQFSSVQTIARELKVDGFVSLQTGELNRNRENESDLKLTGRIDRVDADSEGRVVIYDYKSSSGSTSQFGSWIKKNHLQLLLYAMAVEKGLTSLGPRDVVGAIYYIGKTMERDQGFKIKDRSHLFFIESDGRKKNRIDHEQKLELFSEGRKQIVRALAGISGGYYQPQPSGLEICGKCQWSQLCRAPHLNS